MFWICVAGLVGLVVGVFVALIFCDWKCLEEMNRSGVAAVAEQIRDLREELKPKDPRFPFPPPISIREIVRDELRKDGVVSLNRGQLEGILKRLSDLEANDPSDLIDAKNFPHRRFRSIIEYLETLEKRVDELSEKIADRTARATEPVQPSPESSWDDLKKAGDDASEWLLMNRDKTIVLSREDIQRLRDHGVDIRTILSEIVREKSQQTPPPPPPSCTFISGG